MQALRSRLTPWLSIHTRCPTLASGSLNCTGLPRPPFPLYQPCCTVILLTKLKFVDNSDNAKRVTKLDQPYCIGLPRNSKVAGFGDVITIAHRGKVHKALVVSNRMPSKRLPRYESHNIVLLNDKLEPVGTRIIGPLPSVLRKRGGHFSKVIAIATKFI